MPSRGAAVMTAVPRGYSPPVEVRLPERRVARDNGSCGQADMRRSSTSRVRGVVGSSVISLVFVVSAATPAGAGDTSPQKWADGVCSAVQDWIDSVQSTVEGLRGAGSLENASQQAISGLDAATAQLADSIEQLGKPSTSDSRKARDAVEELSNELSTDVESIKGELANLPTDPAGIAASFALIGSDISNAIDEVQSTATTLRGLARNGKLKKAFQSSSECRSLKSAL
jgi:hypothetical protein